jgi:hypothetical protein
LNKLLLYNILCLSKQVIVIQKLNREITTDDFCRIYIYLLISIVLIDYTFIVIGKRTNEQHKQIGLEQ